MILIPENRSSNPESRMEQVAALELPEGMDAVIDDYGTVGDRDPFLWKWLHAVLPEIELSCVSSADADRLDEAKLLASMFVVCLDDVAEKRRDRPTFEEASKIPFASQSVDSDRPGVDADCLVFVTSLWERLEEIVAQAPRAEEFADIFEFDFKQTINAIGYSFVVNRNLEMANPAENERYDAPNMMLYTYVNLDLMHSPSFDRADLAPLRKAALAAQKMARVGNGITTWQRELEEGDFSSGVFACALENGVVTPDELLRAREGDEEDVRRVAETILDAGVEDDYFRQWEESYGEMQALESAATSVDLGAFRDGMREVMKYHLASRGRK